ncbi:hypothetical protein L3N51_02436 [Metallosphaera sp. J1]|uniref:ParA family protein n=1 Tax=Metallosphaera javensis (ex Hofmann et al. 2022) TaxID=99938 RepID=UPI001EDD5D3E|nr:ParA family protein [Metallosphaera javensis (ex Hofmann et al. 2022)]MCG3110139.1 hypothetical protein [Metallosphaera javensis (ex Hofmann et al. 2022)]
MTKKIIITGVKGGTGKSFVSFLLLKKLIEKWRVLFVDMDNTLTVSRLLGILHLNDLYDARNDHLDLWKNDKVVVLPMGTINQSRLKEFQKIYREVARESDMIVIDSSNISNPALEVEGHLLQCAEINFVLVTTPQPFSLKTNLDALLSLEMIYPAAPSQKVMVLNMVKDEPSNLPNNVTLVKIPFIRQLYIYGASHVVDEFPSINASIEKLANVLGTKFTGGLP